MPSVIRKKATQETTTSPITIQPIGSRFQLGTRFLVRGGRVESMRVGETYVVGYVPWYAQVWGRAIRHPILLGVLGAIGGLLLAIAAFTALQELSARRRGI